jgi:hypothetical protein
MFRSSSHPLSWHFGRLHLKQLVQLKYGVNPVRESLFGYMVEFLFIAASSTGNY